MVGYAYGNQGRLVNAEYHRFRENARRTAYSIEEFSPQEIERYDLDTVDFDRTVKQSTYESETVTEAEGSAKGGCDLAELGRR